MHWILLLGHYTVGYQFGMMMVNFAFSGCMFLMFVYVCYMLFLYDVNLMLQYWDLALRIT